MSETPPSAATAESDLTGPRKRAPTGLVVAAFVMTMSSSFGQTYFIGVFAPSVKGALTLTDGAFGGLYTVANLASALVLLWAGRIADRFRIRWLAVAVLLALAAMCAAMAAVVSVWMLVPVLFGLRLFGQGAIGHLAITGVGRWYVRRRGRMMSIAVLGFSAGEAMLPISAVALIASAGWREAWLLAAGALCVVSVPLVLFFLRREPAHDQEAETSDKPAAPQRQWTRAEVIRRPEFFGVVAGIVAPGFIVTAIFFHQGTIVETNGWTLAWFAGWVPAYALTTIMMALVTGWLVDRFGARPILPLYLLPMAGGVVVLALWASPYAVAVFMLLSALTTGSAATLLGALWAELFGTRHLGAIRSVAVATQIFVSALAPGLIGVLLDLGAGLDVLLLAMAAYAVACSLWLKLLVPRLVRLAHIRPGERSHPAPA